MEPIVQREAHQLARRNDRPTSKQAAKAALGDYSDRQLRVLEVFRIHGRDGLTDYELESLCGSHGSTWRTRRAELTEAGIIIDTDNVRVIAGSRRTVWKLKNN